MRSAILYLAIAFAVACPLRAVARDVPQQIGASDLAALPGDREAITTRPAVVTLVPTESVARTARDPKDHAEYAASCTVYVAEGGDYVRRFTIHVPARDLLPFARRAARFMGILWTMADRRFGRSCARLRETPLDVWLTRIGEPGGEQIDTNLYVYNLLAERSGIEWARELAHEYGHYLLPGASGYTDPESWANGVLGERLFLKWLSEDTENMAVIPEDVPYLSPADLNDYLKKQVNPLVDGVRSSGADPATLKRADKRGMNALTGLLCYVDSTYGSRALMDMLDYLPRDSAGHVHGIDFLYAFATWAGHAESLRTAVPAGGCSVFVPAGSFVVSVVGKRGGELSLAGITASRTETGWRIRVASSGWRTVTLGGRACTIEWTRLGMP